MGDRPIVAIDDLLTLLDSLLQDRSGSWWDEFYAACLMQPRKAP